MTEEKSLLIQFIGDRPASRIVDFLIENKGLDFSKTEISKGANISRAALFKYWSKIEGFGLVRVTRRFGKTRLYTLNTESDLVQELLKIESTLIKQAMEEGYKEQAGEKLATPAPI